MELHSVSVSSIGSLCAHCQTLSWSRWNLRARGYNPEIGGKKVVEKVSSFRESCLILFQPVVNCFMNASQFNGWGALHGMMEALQYLESTRARTLSLSLTGSHASRDLTTSYRAIRATPPFLAIVTNSVKNKWSIAQHFSFRASPLAYTSCKNFQLIPFPLTNLRSLRVSYMVPTFHPANCAFTLAPPKTLTRSPSVHGEAVILPVG